jgi:hypothetical protein
MIAARDHVHAGGKNFFGDFWRDTGAASGIFAVGDDEIERVPFAQFRQKNFDRASSGFADDVANEKNFHEKILTTKTPKTRRKSGTADYGGFISSVF